MGRRTGEPRFRTDPPEVDHRASYRPSQSAERSLTGDQGRRDGTGAGDPARPHGGPRLGRYRSELPELDRRLRAGGQARHAGGREGRAMRSVGPCSHVGRQAHRRQSEPGHRERGDVHDGPDGAEAVVEPRRPLRIALPRAQPRADRHQGASRLHCHRLPRRLALWPVAAAAHRCRERAGQGPEPSPTAPTSRSRRRRSPRSSGR